MKISDTKLASKQLARAYPPTAKPNSKRVEAGRLNRMKQGPLTAERRESLRQTALQNQPWRHSTGPRSPAGKALVALNGKRRQLGPISVRELRAQICTLNALQEEMQATRSALMEMTTG